jgi:hypothetical protein
VCRRVGVRGGGRALRDGAHRHKLLCGAGGDHTNTCGDRALVCARVCVRLHGESRGARLLGCTCLHLCERRRCGHGGDTKPSARARRRHRDESSTSRFRRGGVQGRSGRKVRTWGRWLDGHTCAGALGFTATARRNVEHGHRLVKQGSAPRLRAYVCVPNANSSAMAATQN